MAAELPSDMILFPRRMFYVQAVLYPVVALAAFGAGYAIGRGGGRPASGGSQDDLAHRRVPIEGRATYDTPQGGQNLPDDGAVFVFLPVGRPPAHRPAADGLAPSLQAPPQEDEAVRAVREMGGGFARADRAGQFMTYVPQHGEYYVLVVSGHATRSSRTTSEEHDLAELDQYLDQPKRLIEGRQYRWSQEELELECSPLDVKFPAGKSG